MITVRKSNERGHFDHGWLKTFHTFSFADYHDPKFEGFRSLRVINEDWVEPGKGFGTHPHRDMEIITYVLEGALQHKDSMGNGSVIQPGEVQYMSAGTGVTHSEFNPSDQKKVHLLQIWIYPDRSNYEPTYGQKNFSEKDKKRNLCLVVSSDGRDGSIQIRQDISLYASLLAKKESVNHTFQSGRAGWLQVAKGKVEINGESLAAGDGASIEKEKGIEIVGQDAMNEILLFDLK